MISLVTMLRKRLAVLLMYKNKIPPWNKEKSWELLEQEEDREMISLVEIVGPEGWDVSLNYLQVITGFWI